ncbi:xanthine dehydrogenase [Clostridium sp. P21]|uniref:Xanthine dehydrogenase n=1 Tax=Clostridium muellerianum TaxID=2716538 RepID=A0A7Y0HMC8_9CLOT|nr:XdhC/CoxI family protein [Clostridium muellerianum]NMM62849.1 xanthine dehydrogenase [Clostridium muellerianum]
MNSSSYESLLNQLNEGKKAAIVTIINNENSENSNFPRKFLFTEEGLLTDNNDYNFPDAFYEKVQYALESGMLQFGSSEKEIYLIEPYFPEPKLIVLGGGHIAKPLVEFGSKLGFSVTVVDDRPSFANSKRFPDAKNVICESFDKCFDLINLNPSTFVVIVTRGHRHDMDCLKQVLKHNTAYTGMIGSKRRVRGVMDQLVKEGYSKEKLDKVNSPIGLDIGAVTPEEIAVSIISQVVSYRRLVNTKNGRKKIIKSNWPEFDRDVLLALSKEEKEPKAIITIISTKGSVPRKEGAKMLVYPHGKILGSIGGGCSEGSVINSARYILRNGGHQIQTIDMTGYVAEEEGMVCGGIMDVLIELF